MAEWHSSPIKKDLKNYWANPLLILKLIWHLKDFIAYQDRQYVQGMKLVTNEHIFFEFVPFDDENFDTDGNIGEKPRALMIHEVEEGKDYAILISTTAGAWRYLIGDTS